MIVTILGGHDYAMWKLFVRDRKGVAAIEAAIVIPIIMSIMLAAVDYGSVFYVQHTMNTVANDVSRSLALGHMTADQAKTAAESRLPTWGSAVFTVSAAEFGADNVRIVITVPAQDAALANFAPLGLIGNLTVTAIKRKV